MSWRRDLVIPSPLQQRWRAKPDRARPDSLVSNEMLFENGQQIEGS